MIESINTLTATNILIYLVLFILAIIEITSRVLKKRIKIKFKNKKKNMEEFGEIEKVSMVYYRQYQWLDIIRLFSLLVGVVIILIAFNIEALNILAVVAGTLIIVLREFIFSFISFFYLISIYKTGDDIRIDDTLGEIFRMTPLYVALSGKDDDGEYNGKLHRIPNFSFIGQKVELQELKTNDYRRVVLKSIYTKESFQKPFDEWLSKIKAFLEEILPQRHIGRVGNYKGYTGTKYKMNFDYGEKGEVIIRISFIAHYPKDIELKEKVIQFIESLHE